MRARAVARVRCVLGEQGQAMFGGQNLLSLSSRELDKVRGRDITMVFQDPMAALDPRMRVADLVSEPLLIHGIGEQRPMETLWQLVETVWIREPRADGKPLPRRLMAAMAIRSLA